MDYEYVLNYKMNNAFFKFHWKIHYITNIIACIGILISLIFIFTKPLMMNTYYNCTLFILCIFSFTVVVLYIIYGFSFSFQNTISKDDYNFIWYKGFNPFDIYKTFHTYYITSYILSSVLLLCTIIYSNILGESLSVFIIAILLLFIYDVCIGRYIAVCKRTIINVDIIKKTIRNTQYNKTSSIFSFKDKLNIISTKRLCMSKIFKIIQFVSFVCIILYFYNSKSIVLFFIFFLIECIVNTYKYIELKYITKYDSKKIDVIL